MGKFYELFHMDAIIGIKEMNLLMMKVRKNLIQIQTYTHFSKREITLMPDFLKAHFQDMLTLSSKRAIKQLELNKQKRLICSKKGYRKDQNVTRLVIVFQSISILNHTIITFRLSKENFVESLQKERGFAPLQMVMLQLRAIRTCQPFAKLLVIADTHFRFGLQFIAFQENLTGSETRYGVCFVDTTIGEIHVMKETLKKD